MLTNPAWVRQNIAINTENRAVLTSKTMATHSAVAITGPGALELIDVPTSSPGPEDVLIKVDYVALIPFDEYQLDNGFGLSPSDYPRVIGFASSGFVKAVGSNIRDLKEGDSVRYCYSSRVIFEDLPFAGHCI
jgi:NADPH:quinone reductase-like Zn-dependent oxidoreductase